MARVAICLNLAWAVSLWASAAYAQGSPIEASNPVLQASLDRLERRSALWREAVDGIRSTGRRVVVLTPDQVRVVDERERKGERFDPTLLAEVAPVADESSRVDTVLVVVNLELLRERHHAARLLPIELEMDLDRILIHEIYGHAIPYLLAGDLSGRCGDPEPRQRAVDSCSIRRENAVREEVGLGRRVDAGIDGLNLARRMRQ